MKRREFLRVPAQSIGGMLLYTIGGAPVRLQAQQGHVRLELRFFTAAEAQVVQAACERIIPGDETGPGATEANVVVYIDRQLAGPYGRDKYRYTKPPWIESIPEHGYQGKANPQQIYRANIPKLGGDFATVPPEERDRRLVAIETTLFFRMLRQHTIEGMFCDPLHGGNKDLIGWQLIGYPGPRMSYRDDIEKYFDKPFHAEPRSLEQIVGHKVKGWEDEE
ncbi:MAG: gluconate 2-dehydrogenase subunit 3 family protein [Bryobacteraceae bacterium]